MVINNSFDFKNWGEVTTPREALHAQDMFNIIGLSRGFGIKSGCEITRSTNTITVASGDISVGGSDVSFAGDSITIDDTDMSSGQYRWTIVYITPAGAIGKTDGVVVATGDVAIKPTDKTNLVICAALKTHGSDLIDEDIQPMALDLSTTGTFDSMTESYLESQGFDLSEMRFTTNVDLNDNELIAGGRVDLYDSSLSTVDEKRWAMFVYNDGTYGDGSFSLRPRNDDGSFINSGTIFSRSGDLHLIGSLSASQIDNATLNASLEEGGAIDIFQNGSLVQIRHEDTSSQGSVNNSGGTVIQDITLDTYGHITGLVSYNLDNRYYTESQSDGRYLFEDSYDENKYFVGGEVAQFRFWNTTDSGGANVKGVEFRASGTTRDSGDTFISFRDGNNNQLGYIHSSVVYSTFTGGHDSQHKDFNKHEWRKGWILVSNGIIDEPKQMSRSLPYIEVSEKEYDKTVIGVYSGWQKGHRGKKCQFHKDLDGDGEPDGQCESHHSQGWDADQDLITYNALGEGLILVTNANGIDPQNGDYITTSQYKGIGMVQHDDILHSYTVAKITENINWDEIEIDEEYGIKIALVGCTYHCG